MSQGGNVDPCILCHRLVQHRLATSCAKAEIDAVRSQHRYHDDVVLKAMLGDSFMHVRSDIPVVNVDVATHLTYKRYPEFVKMLEVAQFTDIADRTQLRKAIIQNFLDVDRVFDEADVGGMVEYRTPVFVASQNPDVDAIIHNVVNRYVHMYIGILPMSYDFSGWNLPECLVLRRVGSVEGMIYMVLPRHLCAVQRQIVACDVSGENRIYIDDTIFSKKGRLEQAFAALVLEYGRERDATLQVTSISAYDDFQEDGTVLVIGAEEEQLDTLESLDPTVSVDMSLRDCLKAILHYNDGKPRASNFRHVVRYSQMLFVLLKYIEDDDLKYYSSLLVLCREVVRDLNVSGYSAFKAVKSTMKSDRWLMYRNRFSHVFLQLERTKFRGFEMCEFDKNLYRSLFVLIQKTHWSMLYPQVKVALLSLLGLVVETRFSPRGYDRDFVSAFSGLLLSVYNAVSKPGGFHVLTPAAIVRCDGFYAGRLASMTMVMAELADDDLSGILNYKGESLVQVYADLLPTMNGMTYHDFFLNTIGPLISPSYDPLIDGGNVGFSSDNTGYGYCYLHLFKRERWIAVLLLNHFDPYLSRAPVLFMKKFVRADWFAGLVVVLRLSKSLIHILPISVDPPPSSKKRLCLMQSLEMFDFLSRFK